MEAVIPKYQTMKNYNKIKDYNKIKVRLWTVVGGVQQFLQVYFRI